LVQFCFMVMLALSFQHFWPHLTDATLRRTLLVLAVLLLVAAHFIFAKPFSEPILKQGLVVELLLAMLFIWVVLNYGQTSRITSSLLVVVILLVPLDQMYEFSKKPWRYKSKVPQEMLLDDVHQDITAGHLKAYAPGKDKIKIVNMLPAFHGSYFAKNMPWVLRDKVNVMDYTGYEQHIAVPKDYKKHMFLSVPQGGKDYIYTPDPEWLKKTGADYVVFRNSYDFNTPGVVAMIDDTKPTLALPYEVTVAALKQEVPQEKDGKTLVFDNGYIRVYSADPAATVSGFTSNDANDMRFTLAAKAPSEVEYLFWPRKRVVVKVGGNKAETRRENGLMQFTVPTGKLEVRLCYWNLKLILFLVGYGVYFAALLCLLFLPFFTRTIRKLQSTNEATA
jgi:hypothetical protein